MAGGKDAAEDGAEAEFDSSDRRLSDKELIGHIQRISSVVQTLPADGGGAKLRIFLNTLKAESARRNLLLEFPSSSSHGRNFSSENSYSSAMVGNSRTRPYYFRRCKRVRPTTIDSLPNDILVDILARVPADDLCERAMLVCRSWYHIIRSYDFINTQIHRSTYGLLLGPRNPVFVTATQGRIETHEFRNPCNSLYFTSANTGLALDRCPRTTLLYIKNVATRQTMELPFFGRRSRCYDGTFGIGYAAASMKHKVARPFRDSILSSGIGVSILTVGVDKSWRNVEAQHLPEQCRVIFFTNNSLSSEGFIHWVWTGERRAEVVTLDVETEVITWSEVPLPQASISFETTTFLSTGRLLTLLIGHGDLSWEVWGKGPGDWEWSKVLPDIKLGEGAKSRLEKFARFVGEVGDVKVKPWGWVKYPEVLAFYLCCDSQTCIFYNLDTHEIDSIQLRDHVSEYSGYVHKNSLIWVS